MNRSAVAFVAVLGSVGGASRIASANIEIGGTAGLHVFRDANALGTQKNDDVRIKSSALFGFRLTNFFTKMFGLEIEAGAIPSEAGNDDVTFDIWMGTVRANVIAQFRTNDPTNRFIPFATAGAGAMRVLSIGTTDASLFHKDTDGMGWVGGGLTYLAGNGWGVRGDLRLVIAPSNEGGVTEEVEILLSLFRDFGFKATPKVVKKADDDPDKDGIVGAKDQCPNDAEDKDDFQDDDGCPDLDNDADTIADTTDQCPKDPEDKDSFKDDDGCPDPDNDDDGVLDANDKCGDKPETKNGFEDDDGCPDEIPAKLLKFTGSIQGINFKTSSADLAGGSTKILDKAIAVLTEFKDVKLEIGGHTDDVALKNSKKFADNDALSQARADTVKAYFVKKGIAEDRVIAKGYGSSKPLIEPSGLKGGKLAAARAKNRRVEFVLISSLDSNPGAGAGTPPETKPEEKKPEETKPEEKKPEEKKAPEPKADDKKAAEPKADDKKAAEPKADDKGAAKKADDKGAAKKADDKGAKKGDDKKGSASGGIADPFGQ